MAVKKFKPTSAGVRFQTKLDFKEISPVRPEKRLTVGLRSTGGRNNQGRIDRRASRRRPQAARTASSTSAATRTASRPRSPRSSTTPTARRDIALLHYADGEKRYILAPDGLKVGATRASRARTPTSCWATRCRCARFPLGTTIHNIELQPGQGRRRWPLGRRAAQLVAKEGDYAHGDASPPARSRKVHVECMATIGQVGNLEHENVSHRQGRPQALDGPPAARPRRRR